MQFNKTNQMQNIIDDNILIQQNMSCLIIYIHPQKRQLNHDPYKW